MDADPHDEFGSVLTARPDAIIDALDFLDELARTEPKEWGKLNPKLVAQSAAIIVSRARAQYVILMAQK